MVRLAKGNAAADEVFREVGGEHVGAQSTPHRVRVDAERREAPGGDLQAIGHGVHGVEKALPRLLEVLVVRRRGSLHHGEESGEGPEDAPRLTPQELQRVRVLLLGHQGRSGGVGVGELDHAELPAAVDDQVLGPAGQVDHRGGGPEHRLGYVIAVGHRVHAVGAHPLEGEIRRERLPVHPKGVTRERAGSQRQGVDPGHQVRDAHVVALPRGGVRQEPVRPSHRLRGLQVGEARHDDVHLALRALHRDGDELPEVSAEEHELVSEPHAGVGGHLVVARSTGVELAGDWADELAEPSLVRGVDVLVAGLDDEGVRGPLFGNLAEPLDELVALVVGDDARLRERLGVALAAADVLLRHPAVEGEGLVELLHERVDVLRESPAPELLLLARRLGSRGRHGDDGATRDEVLRSGRRRTLGDALERGGREDDGRDGEGHGHRYVECEKGVRRASEGKRGVRGRSSCRARRLRV